MPEWRCSCCSNRRSFEPLVGDFNWGKSLGDGGGAAVLECGEAVFIAALPLLCSGLAYKVWTPSSLSWRAYWTLHGTTVITVQGEHVLDADVCFSALFRRQMPCDGDMLAPEGVLEETCGKTVTLAFIDIVVDVFAAVEIEDRVKEEEHAAHIGVQVGDVPAPDLVRAVSNQPGTVEVVLGALTTVAAPRVIETVLIHEAVKSPGGAQVSAKLVQALGRNHGGSEIGIFLKHCHSFLPGLLA